MRTSMLIFVLALIGCTTGQAEVDVSATTVTTFPAAPASLYANQIAPTGMTTDVAVKLDFRSDIESLADLGKLTGTISKNFVSGPDLGTIRHVTVSLVAADGTLPVQTLSDVDVPDGATQIALPVMPSDAQIIEYLQEGPVIAHFYVTGSLPERAITLTHTFVAHLNVAVSGPVLRL